MEIQPEQINTEVQLHNDCDGFENSPNDRITQAEEDKFVDDFARALVFMARSIHQNK